MCPVPVHDSDAIRGIKELYEQAYYAIYHSYLFNDVNTGLLPHSLDSVARDRFRNKIKQAIIIRAIYNKKRRGPRFPASFITFRQFLRHGRPYLFS